MSILNNIFRKEKEEKKKPEVKAAKSVAKKIKSEKVVKPVATPKVQNETFPSASKRNTAKKKSQNAYKTLVKPLITEKATYLGMLNKYMFEVSPSSNKIEIKKAIESVYGVSPVAVNIISVSGKQRRYGRVLGRTKNWKKAIITLKQGEKIEIYEGV